MNSCYNFYKFVTKLCNIYVAFYVLASIPDFYLTDWCLLFQKFKSAECIIFTYFRTSQWGSIYRMFYNWILIMMSDNPCYALSYYFINRIMLRHCHFSKYYFCNYPIFSRISFFSSDERFELENRTHSFACCEIISWRVVRLSDGYTSRVLGTKF